MALSDPQSVTIAGTAVSLPRIGLTLEEGKFGDSAAQVNLGVKHFRTKRIRDVVRLDKASIVADPLFPANNQNVSYSVQLIADRPRNGVTTAMVAELADALVKWATPANVAKMLAGES